METHFAPWQWAGWRRLSMRWLPTPTFSSALLLSKVHTRPQPLFLESPSQPSPRLPPAHCPPKPPVRGPQVPASICLPSLKPPPQTQVSQGCLGHPLPGDPDDSAWGPSTPPHLQGKPLRKTTGCFVEEFIIIVSIKFLEEGKSLLFPPSPLAAPPSLSLSSIHNFL